MSHRSVKEREEIAVKFILLIFLFVSKISHKGRETRKMILKFQATTPRRALRRSSISLAISNQTEATDVMRKEK